jgi:hypothetical protein
MDCVGVLNILDGATDASPSLDLPETDPSRAHGSLRAESIAVQSSSDSPAQARSLQHRGSHPAVNTQQDVQGDVAAKVDSPTRDVYDDTAAVAYARAHLLRTIPDSGPYLLHQTISEDKLTKLTPSAVRSIAEPKAAPKDARMSRAIWYEPEKDREFARFQGNLTKLMPGTALDSGTKSGTKKRANVAFNMVQAGERS